ncbi:hypothetical protein JT362_30240 [Actinophytocola sp. S1-96]|uniref:Secreted protein n=1 Tax=Actinophytocola gossypii TaxID=2812003 RepID=A0ABT2JHP9_9PSEU|nr:hypothetical protein [Actinophytocola gossypii]MCT2587412.1 hypothetical protein [Actinophytocola gossypii]
MAAPRPPPVTSPAAAAALAVTSRSSAGTPGIVVRADCRAPPASWTGSAVWPAVAASSSILVTASSTASTARSAGEPDQYPVRVASEWRRSSARRVRELARWVHSSASASSWAGSACSTTMTIRVSRG